MSDLRKAIYVHLGGQSAPVEVFRKLAVQLSLIEPDPVYVWKLQADPSTVGHLQNPSPASSAESPRIRTLRVREYYWKQSMAGPFRLRCFLRCG